MQLQAQLMAPHVLLGVPRYIGLQMGGACLALCGLAAKCLHASCLDLVHWDLCCNACDLVGHSLVHPVGHHQSCHHCGTHAYTNGNTMEALALRQVTLCPLHAWHLTYWVWQHLQCTPLLVMRFCSILDKHETQRLEVFRPILLLLLQTPSRC
jgi:hypothetical protein